MAIKHVWNCSVRGDRKLGRKSQAEPLDNCYVVAPDIKTAVAKAIDASGLTRVDYVQATRVTKMRGLIQ